MAPRITRDGSAWYAVREMSALIRQTAMSVDGTRALLMARLPPRVAYGVFAQRRAKIYVMRGVFRRARKPPRPATSKSRERYASTCSMRFSDRQLPRRHDRAAVSMSRHAISSSVCFAIFFAESAFQKNRRYAFLPDISLLLQAEFIRRFQRFRCRRRFSSACRASAFFAVSFFLMAFASAFRRFHFAIFC